MQEALRHIQVSVERTSIKINRFSEEVTWGSTKVLHVVRRGRSSMEPLTSRWRCHVERCGGFSGRHASTDGSLIFLHKWPLLLSNS